MSTNIIKKIPRSEQYMWSLQEIMKLKIENIDRLYRYLEIIKSPNAKKSILLIRIKYHDQYLFAILGGFLFFRQWTNVVPAFITFNPNLFYHMTIFDTSIPPIISNQILKYNIKNSEKEIIKKNLEKDKYMIYHDTLYHDIIVNDTNTLKNPPTLLKLALHSIDILHIEDEIPFKIRRFLQQFLLFKKELINMMQ
uniref:Uncharacterized protein n=1 Tax=Faxonius propinquus nudivirus TaxID=3139431 RepID=A0AAU8GBG8_9VIRU